MREILSCMRQQLTGEAEYVKKLLRSWTDFSVVTEYYWTPIYWATHIGNISCVKLLVEAGANLSDVSD